MRNSVITTADWFLPPKNTFSIFKITCLCVKLKMHSNDNLELSKKLAILLVIHKKSILWNILMHITFIHKNHSARHFYIWEKKCSKHSSNTACSLISLTFPLRRKITKLLVANHAKMALYISFTLYDVIYMEHTVPFTGWDTQE